MGPLHMVCAHAREASPLVAHFRLQRARDAAPFQVFERGDVRLVISGSGKLAAAAATAFLYQLAGAKRQAAWLNVGVAGHRSLGVGVVRAVQKVTEESTGATWYPQRLDLSAMPSSELITLDAPCHDYPKECLVDMEGCGFFATATRFSTAELVHSTKVVSDNQETPVGAETVKGATEAVEKAVPAIAAFAEGLAALAASEQVRLQPPAGFDELLERGHYTATQRSTLDNTLRRRAVLLPEAPIHEAHYGAPARQTLRALAAEVAAGEDRLSLVRK